MICRRLARLRPLRTMRSAESPVLLAPYRSDEILTPRAHCAVALDSALNQLAQPFIVQLQVIRVPDQVAESLELAQVRDGSFRQERRTQAGKLEG